MLPASRMLRIRAHDLLRMSIGPVIGIEANVLNARMATLTVRRVLVGFIHRLINASMGPVQARFGGLADLAFFFAPSATFSPALTRYLCVIQCQPIKAA